MNTPVNADTIHNGDGSARHAASHLGKTARSEAAAKFQDLLDGVDDLISQVSSVDGAELRKIQAKLRVSLSAAKSALNDGANHVRRQARQVANTTDSYVHDSPWQALGIAAVAGFALGLVFAAQRRGQAT
jgi:ElaB/YqjD/DUF883 family membrane-anchored ribosome-binding protein